MKTNFFLEFNLGSGPVPGPVPGPGSGPGSDPKVSLKV